MGDIFSPLPRQQVIKAVERRCPARVPLVQARWWGEGLVEQYGDRLTPLEQRYPEDAVFLWIDLRISRPSWTKRCATALITVRHSKQ
jgi:hypothetical protein